MKHYFAFSFALALLIALPMSGSCNFGVAPAATSYFNLRSQGVNAARDMLGWQRLINRCGGSCFYGATAVTLEFDQTFRSNQIAQSLFGADISCVPAQTSLFDGNCCSFAREAFLTVSGSRAPNRGSNDWLADYFGLPTDYVSIISFAPRIQNFVADIAFYFGLDEIATGLYFRCNVPLVHTNWNLNFCETVINPGVNPITPGYYGSITTCPITRAHLFSNATDFFCGGSTSLTSGSVITPLTASKWSCGCETKGKNKVAAAVNMALGWNFLCCDDLRFGLNLRVSAPTGDRPTGEYLFEPIVGNGHHWELGGGFSGQVTLWEFCDYSRISLYAEGNITHLFTACQVRSFDLCGRPNSRYMLAERMGANSELVKGCPAPMLTGLQCGTLATEVFANRLTTVANLTQTPIDVSIAVQADVAFKLAYESSCGFEWDLGYNFWIRSCEKISRSCCATKDPLSDGTTWALKGDAMIVGFEKLTGGALGTAHEISATEHCATIHAGTNGFIPGDDLINAIPMTNPGIDNPQFANVASSILINENTDQINTSIQPIFLTDADVDLQGTRGLSNKIFTHLSYTWQRCKEWQPFLGVGASVEFGPKGGCCTSDLLCVSGSKKDCRNIAVSQWGAWVKGGFAFN